MKRANITQSNETPRQRAYKLVLLRYRGSTEYIPAFRYFNRLMRNFGAYSKIQFPEFKIMFVNLKNQK